MIALAAHPRPVLQRTALSCALGMLVLTAATSARAQFLGLPPGPVVATSPNTAAQPTQGGQNSVRLPGDSFEIQIYGVPQYDYKGRIDDDGTASLPLAGVIRLGGQSISAAERAIEDKLVATNIMKAPHVSLHVTESPNHFVTVTGEVKTPGPVPLYGDKHLLDIISAAGGLTPLSSPLVTVYRRGSEEPIQIQLPTDAAAIGSKNIAIFPGDSIVVAKLGVVYVLGAFHQQGAVPLRNNSQLTLIEAMSLAGGVNYEAAVRKAFILRSSPNGQIEIPFDVNAVVRHRVPDPVLQNEDIILIPSSNMKAALKGGAAGVAASLLAGIGYITVK